MGDSTREEDELEDSSIEGGRTDALGGTLTHPTTPILSEARAGTLTHPSTPIISEARAGTSPTLSTNLTHTQRMSNGIENTFRTLVSQNLIPPIETMSPTTMNFGRENSSSNNNVVSRTNEPGLTLLADTALNDEADVSRTPVLDPNLEDINQDVSRHENESIDNVFKAGRINEDRPDIAAKEAQNNVEGSKDKFDVFFVHPMPNEEPPTYFNSSAAYPSSVFPRTPPNSKASLIKP
ncbi:hypothetical protein DEU56DRAFT_903490, partial [Suillus clintonianus]|uniref:uncharacterized protein n=1 Tax=Suillus clintonianus TaxID=1904413 RepID=UPI001B87F18D